MKICFATNNANKLREIREILPSQFEIVGLKDIGCLEDIPETSTTIEGNSILKANYVFENYGIACFADDSGLEIDALNGAPGVLSARYAGPQRSNKDNIDLVLSNLSSSNNRDARFKTVITYKSSDSEIQFEGIIDGEITDDIFGEGGFGYDPIFRPKGYNKTFAEMGAAQKNKISHRGIAVRKLHRFLLELRSE